MYLNISEGNTLELGNVGGFANNWYWIYNENINTKAWGQNFINGGQLNYSKNDGEAVRVF